MASLPLLTLLSAIQTVTCGNAVLSITSSVFLALHVVLNTSATQSPHTATIHLLPHATREAPTWITSVVEKTQLKYNIWSFQPTLWLHLQLMKATALAETSFHRVLSAPGRCLPFQMNTLPGLCEFQLQKEISLVGVSFSALLPRHSEIRQQSGRGRFTVWEQLKNASSHVNIVTAHACVSADDRIVDTAVCFHWRRAVQHYKHK